MSRGFKKQHVVIVFLIAVTAIALLLSQAHKEAILLVKEQFNKQQSIVVKQITLGIEGNVESLEKELEFLSRLHAIKKMEIKEAGENVEEYFIHVKPRYVNDIALLNSEGVVMITATAPQLIGTDFSYREYFKQASLSERSSPIYEFVTFKGVDIGEKGVVIAMPLFPEKGKFGGVVLFTIKINELIAGFIPSKTSTGKTWVIDSKGNIVYHSVYPAGINMETLPGIDLSFKTFIGNLVTGSAYNAEYISPEGAMTIASSYPLYIGGQIWPVVTATPEKVIGRLLINFNSKYLRIAFIAVLATIGFLVLVVFVINKWNQELQYEIAERKKAENLVKASLKEKEVLLKEIHHRVKNNMTVITSLLQMQSDHIKEERYRGIFNNCINRIKSMALIHEKLYRSADLAKIDFDDYLKDMINSMFMSYGLSSQVTLKTYVEDVTWGVDTAIPCGLIINELISNSLKYAFPDGQAGEISVGIHLNDKGEVELTVSDNGIGIPENVDFKNTGSLGMIIVNSLVSQLQGEIELNREKGSAFKVKFSIHK